MRNTKTRRQFNGPRCFNDMDMHVGVDGTLIEWQRVNISSATGIDIAIRTTPNFDRLCTTSRESALSLTE